MWIYMISYEFNHLISPEFILIQIKTRDLSGTVHRDRQVEFWDHVPLLILRYSIFYVVIQSMTDFFIN